MKNIINTLNKLLAVAIILVSLNAFSVVLDPPLITISTNHVDATASTPVTISNRGDASFFGIGAINLALGKHATQSSTYLHAVFAVAGYAVDGNTDGKFSNRSTASTEHEQGAWWQVDLGSKKNINQIIIHNRTDCCADRLSNYQVSISNKADFSTHIYQQDFHDTPKPKKAIKLDAPSKLGRYVRIQLLDKNYLSLAEVQVMGTDPLRFPEVDYSSAQNDFDGAINAPNYANKMAFAAIKADGSIMAWGNPHFGGKKAPADSGYTKIYSNGFAFAALKADGSISTWGSLKNGGTDAPNAPTKKGYTKISSTASAFAALRADGSIKVWGNSDNGGTDAPVGEGYTEIYSNTYAFAALAHDGSIKVWGDPDTGGINAPAGSYTKIYSTTDAFAALRADGSIMAWGSPNNKGANAPDGSGYTEISSNEYAFAALKADGSIVAWGGSSTGGKKTPSGKGYTKIYSNTNAFAALRADGSIVAWGDSFAGGADAPNGKGYTKIYSNTYAFAALRADGSIATWGDIDSGGKNAPDAPTGKGYIKIYSTHRAFAALKADGSIASWGDLDHPWSGLKSHTKAPTDKGYTKIYSNAYTFTAVKPDGSIRTWGDPRYGGAYASGYNLALGKPATESSTYTYSIPVAAGYAVDGNTDGEFLNGSTTHTNIEQGAWWQVDLGSKKNINEIIIYNRIDCCTNRLSNYQVSISDKADFSTHTYQQDSHVAPNPKTNIKLDAPGKQGRYVRIQLLDKNYLSLAEVQVIGVDL